MQHFSTVLRESPPNFDVSDTDWLSIPEITSFTLPDDFSGSTLNDTVLKLILKRRVSLVSEWVITRRDALVRLTYVPQGLNLYGKTNLIIAMCFNPIHETSRLFTPTLCQSLFCGTLAMDDIMSILTTYCLRAGWGMSAQVNLT